MTEMRSPAGEIVQACLCGGDQEPGVGARQGGRATPQGGGGYQDVCTAPNGEKKSTAAPRVAPSPVPGAPTDRDPRLAELRAMGLQRSWIRVAEEIGVDALLAAWRILDADPSSSYDGTTLRVPLRSYKTFLKYQRNRYVEDLARRGLPPDEIRRRLLRQLGESVSIRHIKRLAAGG